MPVQISPLPVVAAVMTAVAVMIAVLMRNLQKNPLSFQRSLSKQLGMVQNRLSLIAAALTVARMKNLMSMKYVLIYYFLEI